MQTVTIATKSEFNSEEVEERALKRHFQDAHDAGAIAMQPRKNCVFYCAETNTVLVCNSYRVLSAYDVKPRGEGFILVRIEDGERIAELAAPFLA